MVLCHCFHFSPSQPGLPCPPQWWWQCEVCAQKQLRLWSLRLSALPALLLQRWLPWSGLVHWQGSLSNTITLEAVIIEIRLKHFRFTERAISLIIIISAAQYNSYLSLCLLKTGFKLAVLLPRAQGWLCEFLAVDETTAVHPRPAAQCRCLGVGCRIISEFCQSVWEVRVVEMCM